MSQPGTVALLAWYVVSKEDGILRRARSKVDCVKWCQAITGSPLVLPGRKRVTYGHYEIRVGHYSDYREFTLMIGSVAHEFGYDLAQKPLYPHAKKPLVREEREVPLA